MDTLIVVAHRGGARLVGEREEKLVVLESIDYPAGRQAEHQGKVPESSDRRAPEPRESQRAHAAGLFAAELADKLHKGRNANRYQELVLIAAPRFLGALRQALDGATAALVRGTLDKDFGGLSGHELLRRLEKL